MTKTQLPNLQQTVANMILITNISNSNNLNKFSVGILTRQGGITCGAIEDPRKSSKAIDERVIINFRDKNGVIARFRDKNVVIVRFCDKNVECLYIYYGVIEE